MSNNPPQVDEVFDEAVRRAPGEERERYLAEACGDDAELKKRIERLLRAVTEAGSFLESPAQEPSPTLDQPITEKPGTQIGPYKLLQQLGEGGMGVVYMAEQNEPVKRRVALKIIKPGMDTRQVIARFEAERQALAMMDHPNIAKVLDAGATESGRPYFVMELVNGLPVTKYCDEQHLTPKERLELFVPICNGVQHAHQKGIIHRDLKPSNILVALYDGQAVPKIIDFGVAKATSQTLTDKTMFTQLGQVVGTLEYMSPEQAERNQLDIDTRSDIYSLGVVLYELLTGEIPFDRERLRSAAFEEMLRIIREEEPCKPSTRVSSSQSLPSIAANRRIEPAKLGSMIRGELDWIVLKAMEKDRGRRYETASRFAEDVQHFLIDQPVTACPPSRSYRFRKFARRNWVAIGTAAAVAATLLVGTMLTTWQAIRAKRAEGVAKQQALLAHEHWKRAETEAENASAEAKRAERELARADEVKSLIKTMLRGAAPQVALGADTELLRKILGDTAARLENNEVTDELVAAELHWTIGTVYGDLGDYEVARAHLTKAVNTYRDLRPGKPETADALSSLGNVLGSLTDYDNSEKLLQEALQLSRLHDPDSLQTAGIMGDLATNRWSQGAYKKSEQMFLDAIEMIRRHVDAGRDPSLLHAHLNNLGGLYQDMGQYSKAVKFHKDSLEAMKNRPAEDPEKLSTLLNLAGSLASAELHDEAEAINQQVFDAYSRILDESHPLRMSAKVNLAGSYLHRARVGQDLDLLNQAKTMFEEVIQGGQAQGNTSHYAVINAKSNLGTVLAYMGEYEQAERLFKSVIDSLEDQDDPNVYRSQVGLAQIYRIWAEKTGDGEYQNRAKKICEQLISQSESSQAIEFQKRTMINAKEILGLVYSDEEQHTEVIKIAHEILQYVDTKYPDYSPLRNTDRLRLVWLQKLGWSHHRLHEYSEAAKWYGLAVEGMKGHPAITTDLRLGTSANLGYVLWKMGDLERARQTLEDCLPQMEQELPWGHPFTVNVLNWLAEIHDQLGNHEPAVKYSGKALEIKVTKCLREGNASKLDDLARVLLTHRYDQLRNSQRAKQLAQLACQQARDGRSQRLWMYLDTLALAQHENGDTATALETQREAIELMPEAIPIEKQRELQQRLDQYEAALERGDAQAAIR